MNHLKTYESFEEDDETILTLKDICLELEDDGFNIIFHTNVDSAYADLVIQKRTMNNLVDYYWREVDEVVQRVIDYLGDKLKSISYISSGEVGYKNLDLSRNLQPTMELYNLVIKFE